MNNYELDSAWNDALKDNSESIDDSNQCKSLIELTKVQFFSGFYLAFDISQILKERLDYIKI